MDSGMKRRVPPTVIRELFNAAGLWEQVQRGDLRSEVKRNVHCDPPIPCHPHCTHSQMVRYVDVSGNRIAVVHQYRKPDGALGGWGRPDPKFLALQGVTYYADVPAETDERRIPCG